MSAAATVRAWNLVRHLPDASEGLILLALADRADQNNNGTYTVAELTKVTGLSAPTVWKAVRMLRNLRIIEWRDYDRAVYPYRLLPVTVPIVRASRAA